MKKVRLPVRLWQEGRRERLLEDVAWADWGANGEIAVVHHVDGRDQIEYPIGHVLYQSNGWISHIRVSPQDDRIAFINHLSLWDDRGSVWLVDHAGRVRTLSPVYDSADGLAWSSDGKEIWFTAADSGYTRSLMAVNDAGKIRTILKIPAGLTLQDMAPDGRVLVSLDVERLAMATSTRAGKASDISWHDWDVAKDISRDGQSVLFEDASEAAGPNYAVAIRKIDGTPPVQLGEGSAGGLSPGWKMGDINYHRESGTHHSLPDRSRPAAHYSSQRAGAHIQRFIAFSGGRKKNYDQRERTRSCRALLFRRPGKWQANARHT